MTFQLDGDRDVEGTAAGFGREFDLLVERLNDRLVDRMHREMDIERRSLVYGFPAQMGSLRDLLQEFLDAVFRPSQFEERPMLRGAYFTSGTQEGTPIDRLMGALARASGSAAAPCPRSAAAGNPISSPGCCARWRSRRPISRSRGRRGSGGGSRYGASAMR